MSRGERGGHAELCPECKDPAAASRRFGAQRAAAMHGAPAWHRVAAWHGGARQQREQAANGDAPMPCQGSPGHPVTPPRGAGLGCGVRVGWAGAGSGSLGNGRSQFPPIDVVARARGLGGFVAYISARRSPCARAAPRPSRCACEAMARLTGARPVAAHRWGCAAAAVFLLLLTVQAGKGGHGGGKAWSGPRAVGPSALTGCQGGAQLQHGCLVMPGGG